MSNTRATPPGPRPSGDRHRPADHPAVVPSITSAPEPLEEDQARRTRRYLIQMGIRLVCFIGAIIVDVTWIRLVLIAAAVVLPYSAVLFANAGRDRVSYDTSPYTGVAPAALPAAPAGSADLAGEDGAGGTHRIIDNEPDDEPDDKPHDGPDDKPHDEGENR